jgi:SAM-dependent methyltransferase
MFELITPITSIERYLVQSGLDYYNKHHSKTNELFYIYGGGMFVPGESYDKLLEAYIQKKLIASIGLTFTLDTISRLTPEIRNTVGFFLRCIPLCYTYDDRDKELALHWGIQAQSGGSPAWLATQDPYLDIDFHEKYLGGMRENAIDEHIKSGYTKDFPISESVGEIIRVAIQGGSSYWLDKDKWGWMGMEEKDSPMKRFARRFNLENNLIYTVQEAMNREPTQFGPNTIENEQEFALNTLCKIEEYALNNLAKKNKTPYEIFEESMKLSGIEIKKEEPTRQSQRVIQPGDVFDPATHYDDNYYAEGKGILYPTTDGFDALYKGPSHDWGGYEIVLDMLEKSYGESLKTARILDVGCGYGGFIQRCMKRDIEAFGIDISESATRKSPVRSRIVCGNILDENVLSAVENLNINMITTWDFWEHIFLSDLEDLQTALTAILPSGGRMVNVICTKRDNEPDYTFPQGTRFQRDNAWLLVSGHVTIRSWSWWQSFFSRNYDVDYEPAYKFQVEKAGHYEFAKSDSWSPKNFLALRKR